MSNCTDVCNEVISMLDGLKFKLNEDSEDHDDILDALSECTLIRTTEYERLTSTPSTASPQSD